MSEWIPVVAALAGTLLGGVLSYVASAIQSAKEERQEWRATILQKLEETHQVVRSIRQGVREGIMRTANMLMTGEAKTERQEPSEIDRLFMLTGFYFPELSPIVVILDEERKRLGQMQVDAIVKAIKSQESRDQTLNTLGQQAEKVEATCNELMQALASLAREHSKLS